MARVYHPELDRTIETNDGYADHLVTSCGWTYDIPGEKPAKQPTTTKKGADA